MAITLHSRNRLPRSISRTGTISSSRTMPAAGPAPTGEAGYPTEAAPRGWRWEHDGVSQWVLVPDPGTTAGSGDLPEGYQWDSSGYNWEPIPNYEPWTDTGGFDIPPGEPINAGPGWDTTPPPGVVEAPGGPTGWETAPQPPPPEGWVPPYKDTGGFELPPGEPYPTNVWPGDPPPNVVANPDPSAPPWMEGYPQPGGGVGQQPAPPIHPPDTVSPNLPPAVPSPPPSSAGGGGGDGWDALVPGGGGVGPGVGPGGVGGGGAPPPEPPPRQDPWWTHPFVSPEAELMAGTFREPGVGRRVGEPGTYMYQAPTLESMIPSMRTMGEEIAGNYAAQHRALDNDNNAQEMSWAWQDYYRTMVGGSLGLGKFGGVKLDPLAQLQDQLQGQYDNSFIYDLMGQTPPWKAGEPYRVDEPWVDRGTGQPIPGNYSQPPIYPSSDDPSAPPPVPASAMNRVDPGTLQGFNFLAGGTLDEQRMTAGRSLKAAATEAGSARLLGRPERATSSGAFGADRPTDAEMDRWGIPENARAAYLQAWDARIASFGSPTGGLPGTPNPRQGEGPAYGAELGPDGRTYPTERWWMQPGALNPDGRSLGTGNIPGPGYPQEGVAAPSPVGFGARNPFQGMMARRNESIGMDLQSRAAGMGVHDAYSGLISEQGRARDTLVNKAQALYGPASYQRGKEYEEIQNKLLNAINQAELQSERIFATSGV